MLWGIDRDEWIQLWSGGLSAVLSAAVAAGVAILVLTSSNRHQQLLVERQLAEQRAEAALAREKAAMADLLAAATKFVSWDKRSMHASVTELIAGYIAAAYRWALEANERDRVRTLLQAGQVLGPCSFAESATGGLSDSALSPEDWGRLVNEVVGDLSVFGLDWYLQTPDKRPLIWIRLEKSVNELEKEVNILRDRLEAAEAAEAEEAKDAA